MALSAKILGAKTASRIPSYMIFPADLDFSHFMIFRAVKRGKKQRSDTSGRQTFASVILPIPANLQLQYAADYEDTGIGMFGSLIANQMNIADVSKGGMDLVKDVKGAIGDFGAEIAGDQNEEGVVQPGIIESLKKEMATDKGGRASSAVGLVSGTAAVAVGTATVGVLGTAVLGADPIGGMIKGGFKKMGFIMNPHLATIFTGIGKKSHNFNFKFMARSDDESNEIHDICKTFRHHMLPSYKYGKFGLTYPNEWEIEFSKQVAPYLYKIGNCVLKSFNVTYNGGGVPVFFGSTNAPIEVDIQLGFAETFIETRDFEGFG